MTSAASSRCSRRPGGLEHGFALYEPTIANPEDRRRFNAAKQEIDAYLDATKGFLVLSRRRRTTRRWRSSTARTRSTSTPARRSSPYTKFNRQLVAADVADAHDAFTSARTQLLIVALLSLLVAAGIAFFLSRQITGGVGQMMRAAEGIADGDVDQEVTIAHARRARPHRRRVPSHDRLPEGDGGRRRPCRRR